MVRKWQEIDDDDEENVKDNGEPQCVGGHIGEEMIHHAAIWKWDGDYWKKLPSLSQKGKKKNKK